MHVLTLSTRETQLDDYHICWSLLHQLQTKHTTCTRIIIILICTSNAASLPAYLSLAYSFQAIAMPSVNISKHLFGGIYHKNSTIDLIMTRLTQDSHQSFLMMVENGFSQNCRYYTIPIKYFVDQISAVTWATFKKNKYQALLVLDKSNNYEASAHRLIVRHKIMQYNYNN